MLNNQILFEDQRDPIPMQMESLPSLPNVILPSLGFHQSFLNKASTVIGPSLAHAHSAAATNLSETLLISAAPNSRDVSCSFQGEQPFSLQSKSVNHGVLGDVNEVFSNERITEGDNDHRLGVSAMKMKRIKSRRKVREPRFCFKTMSDVDVLDDGYKWRKYGQKVVKNTQHPRSYYRGSQDNCHVKKRVERLAEDPRMVITTYEGRHAHPPSNDLEDSQSPPDLLF